jgi:hypothetical protein
MKTFDINRREGVLTMEMGTCVTDVSNQITYPGQERNTDPEDEESWENPENVGRNKSGLRFGWGNIVPLRRKEPQRLKHCRKFDIVQSEKQKPTFRRICCSIFRK